MELGLFPKKNDSWDDPPRNHMVGIMVGTHEFFVAPTGSEALPNWFTTAWLTSEDVL